MACAKGAGDPGPSLLSVIQGNWKVLWNEIVNQFSYCVKKSVKEKNLLLLMMQKHQNLPPQNGISWPFKVLKPWIPPRVLRRAPEELCGKPLAVLATPYTSNQTPFRGIAKPAPTVNVLHMPLLELAMCSQYFQL